MSPRAPSNRRRYRRFDTAISVDYASGDTFLFSSMENISELGIFIRSLDPPPVGTSLRIRFGHQHLDLELEGIVVWVNPLRLASTAPNPNPNPGMGIRFEKLTPEQREQVVEFVRIVAYLQPVPRSQLN